MPYAAYSEHVADARVAYDRLKISDLDRDCLTLVGKPEEAALQAYTDAYTTWNECIGKSGCTTDSIEAELQGKWATATTLLAGVKSKLP